MHNPTDFTFILTTNMSARNTERRVPANFQPADLGQAAPAADARSVLIAHVSSPVVVHRDNTYVVFITDNGLADSVTGYEWIFSENGAEVQRENTTQGEYTYQPQATGALTVTVNFSGGAGTLTMSQDVLELNPELEAIISAADNETGPGIANPQVARELVNDYNIYYRGVQPAVPESGDSFFKLLFDQVYDGVLQRSNAHRARQIEQLAAILNGADPNLDVRANEAAGVCGIRPVLLAMSLPRTSGGTDPYLPWTEIPENGTARVVPLQNLLQAFNGLSPDDKIDLFNLLRFPKSNITVCGKILETLRDRYFPGTSFSDVLTGFNGVRLESIVKHFRQGPVLRNP